MINFVNIPLRAMASQRIARRSKGRSGIIHNVGHYHLQIAWSRQ